MMLKNTRRAITIATAATLVCTTAAACRDSGTPAASPTSPAASPRPTAEDTAAKPAAVILAEARKALANARSVHVKGTIIVKHERMSLDLRIAPESATGRITGPVKGRMVPIGIRMVDGKVYIRSRQLVRLVGGAEAAAAIGNRWISSSENAAELTSFLTPKKFARFLKLEKGQKVSKGKTTTVNGTPVIALTATDSVLYVATTGTPRPVRMAPSSRVRGQRLDLTEYDVPFTVTAPPHVLDVSPGKTV